MEEGRLSNCPDATAEQRDPQHGVWINSPNSVSVSLYLLFHLLLIATFSGRSAHSREGQTRYRTCSSPIGI